MYVLVMDTTFKVVSVLDSYESLIWTDRYGECGDFEIYAPANEELVKLIKHDYYLWMKETEHMMIVESVAIGANAETGGHLIITGRSLESILDRRIVWTQTMLSGNVQNAVKKLIMDNVISPEIPERAISNFIFEESTDEAITSLTIDSAQFTGDNLYDVIVLICGVFSIGFKVTLNDANQFVFKLYAGKNRSYSQTKNPYVIFSPHFENIVNSNYIEDRTYYKNVTLVAGEGEGVDRKTATVGDDSGLSRKELFTDARDISSNVDDKVLTDDEYKQLLERRGHEKLTECKINKSFEGEVEASKMFIYGKDFFLGDVLQIENEYGLESRSRATEIVHSQSDTEEKIYPTFTIVE